MSHSTDAKLIALQLLGIAEHSGNEYILNSIAWTASGDESARLVKLRKLHRAQVVYRLAEEALTDLNILLPEYPQADPEQQAAEQLKAALEAKVVDAITLLAGLDQQTAMSTFAEFTAEAMSEILSAPLDTSKWDQLLEDKRSLIENMPLVASARKESAAKKLEMVRAIPRTEQEPVRLITEKQSTPLLKGLEKRKKALLDKQEWINLRISALSKSDENSPTLLKAIRFNQSANVFLDNYRESLDNINNNLTHAREQATAMLDRHEAENEQSSELNDTTKDIMAVLLAKASSMVVNSHSPSSLTSFVEAATLEINLAEQLVAEAEATLR